MQTNRTMYTAPTVAATDLPLPVDAPFGRRQSSPRAATPYAIGPHSVGWAILGASRNAAPRFLAALRSLPPGPDGAVCAWPSAVYSHNARLAREFAQEHSLAFASVELDVILARPEIQCVYVASHPRHHAAAVEAALEARKHVLCEPPVALTVDEAQRLQRLAERRGRLLGLNYQQRHDPGLLLLRHWLQEHALGDLVGGAVRNTTLLPTAQQGWRVEPAWGGVALDRTMRTVDAVRFLTGEAAVVLGAAAGPRAFGSDETTTVRAVEQPHPPRQGTVAVEVLHGLLQLPRSGAVINTFDAYLAPHVQPRIEIYGSSGAAALQPWQSDTSSAVHFDRYGERLHAEDDAPAADLWTLAIAAFMAAVASGAPAPTPAAEDIANLAICLALLEQAGGPTPG